MLKYIDRALTYTICATYVCMTLKYTFMLDDGGCITYYMVTHDMCSHMCLVYRKSHLMWCKFLECILYMDIKSVVACSVLFADTDGNITSFTQYNIIDYQILPYQLNFQLINSTDIIDLYPGVFYSQSISKTWRNLHHKPRASRKPLCHKINAGTRSIKYCYCTLGVY